LFDNEQKMILLKGSELAIQNLEGGGMGKSDFKDCSQQSHTDIEQYAG
jgi:hypothetical protein